MAEPGGETSGAERAAAVTSSAAPTFERLVPLARLGAGPLACSARGVDVVVVGGADAPRAFVGRCPHQGALLAEGRLEDGVLQCPGHGWRFDCASGERVGKPGTRLQPLATTVRDGELWVDVASLPRDAAAGATAAGGAATRTIASLPAPRGVPLLGVALSLDPERLAKIGDAWSKAHGPMWRVPLPGRRVVSLSDARAINKILRERPRAFRRMSIMSRVMDEIIGPGVFTQEGEAWRPQRRLAVEALSARHVRTFYPTLTTVAERLRRRWERAAASEEVLDIADTFARFTVDVTTSLAFGVDVNTLDGDEDVIQRHIERIFPAIMRRVVSPFPYWRYLRLPRDRALDRSVRTLRVMLGEIIATTRQRLADEPERAARPANFMEAMLAARDDEGRPFDDEVVMGNAFTMLLAGEDTTAHSLGWLVHLVCDHPEVVARLHAEADEVLGDAGVLADPSASSRLPYTTAVASEAMRLAPATGGLFLETNEDVVVRDVMVPRGTEVWVLTRPAMREAERFERPAEFDPERWLTKATPGQEEAFIPFGTGPRICPGRSLALLEINLVISMLARNFTFERVGRFEDVDEVTRFTIAPVGLRVRLRSRAAS